MSETRATISVIRWITDVVDAKAIWDNEIAGTLQNEDVDMWGDEDDPEWEFRGTLRIKDVELPWDEFKVEFFYHHVTRRHGFEFMIESYDMDLYVDGATLERLKDYVAKETRIDLALLDTLVYVWYDGCDRP